MRNSSVQQSWSYPGETFGRFGMTHLALQPNYMYKTPRTQPVDLEWHTWPCNQIICRKLWRFGSRRPNWGETIGGLSCHPWPDQTKSSCIVYTKQSSAFHVQKLTSFKRLISNLFLVQFDKLVKAFNYTASCSIVSASHGSLIRFYRWKNHGLCWINKKTKLKSK